MVLGSGYGGNLKAYLTNPDYQPDLINSWEEILSSGMEWAKVMEPGGEEWLLEEELDTQVHLDINSVVFERK